MKSLRPMGLYGPSPTVQAQSMLQQGWAMQQGGQLPQALQMYEQVIRLQPKNFDALHLAGVISLQLGHARQAVDLITKALKVDRNNTNAYNSRGAAYLALLEFDLALLNYNKAIELDSRSEKAYNNRANVLIKLFRPEEALQDFDKAISLKPDYFSAYNNRGTVLSEMKRYDLARASFEKAIELDPQSVDAHWNLGMCLLRLGEFEQGWLESEWRLQRRHVVGLQSEYAVPMWTGVQAIAGKTILLCCEQGLGDTIQFSRYARLVGDLGARVVLEVQAALVPLLKDLPAVEVVAQGDDLPPHDFYCPLLSLPMLLKTDLSNMPLPTQVSHVEPAQLAVWREKLGEQRKPRVGIVWSGNPSHVDDYKRSIALQDFAQLLSDDIEWISLHQEVRQSDLPALTAHPEIIHFGDQLKVFTDTAALCALLDLVITVDTSVAHLAGTTGKPTWVLVPYNPDWRWLLDRRDNPWYPSVTVYRQSKLGDWSGVLQNARADLKQLFAKGTS